MKSYANQLARKTILLWRWILMTLAASLLSAGMSFEKMARFKWKPVGMELSKLFGNMERHLKSRRGSKFNVAT